MKKKLAALLALMATGCAAPHDLAPPPAVTPQAAAPGLPPHWIVLGEGGRAELRAVAEAGGPCPTIGGVALTVRAPQGDGFPLVCAAPLPPAGKASDMAADRALPAIPAMPRRIVVLGDTGCRLKGKTIQACNDPRAWPFPTLAAAAARLKPDLVIDVGDYQYRESPCPPGDAGCAGTPHGDNWQSWKADFFDPAAPLLAAAPWVFVRGNHEDCHRSWRGYLKLLGQTPAPSACIDHLLPYRVPLGDLTLLVLDDANADDTHIDPAKSPAYEADLAEAARPSGTPVWMALHRPIWGAVTGPLGLPVGGNAQLIAAAQKARLGPPVALMLSGHIHTFEAINYAGTVPPQIVAGNGGDNLDVTPASLAGTIFQGHSGVAVKDGVSVGGFGFLLMTRLAEGWRIDLYDAAGTAEGQCLFTAGRLDCPKLPGPRR